MITQAGLKELLNYNPETGDFAWVKSKKPAGGISSYGYRRIIIDGKEHKAHRLAWLYTHGVFPEDQIDHINGVRHDNRIYISGRY